MMTDSTFVYPLRYAASCISLVFIASCSTQYPSSGYNPVISQNRDASSESHSQPAMVYQSEYAPIIIERHSEVVSVELTGIDKGERDTAESQIPEPMVAASITTMPNTMPNTTPIITIPTSPQLDAVEPPVINRMNVATYNATLFQASEQGDTDLILQMIGQGANISSANTNGETALHSAAAHNQLDAARILIENGADVNSRTVLGWTPLHSAARFGAENVITLLIQFGSLTQLRNNDDKSALDLARQAGHQRVIGVLTGR
ncbi:MAG: ankyrin repeat domain-containing protein [Thiotrichaceae bacterium]